MSKILGELRHGGERAPIDAPGVPALGDDLWSDMLRGAWNPASAHCEWNGCGGSLWLTAEGVGAVLRPEACEPFREPEVGHLDVAVLVDLVTTRR